MKLFLTIDILSILFVFLGSCAFATTTYEVEVECSVCGNKVKQRKISSTNTFGSMDLDTRPPEMQRSTMMYWVNCCPDCGYCAGSVDEELENARELIGTEEYKTIRADTLYPPLARDFLSHAFLLEKNEMYKEAAWACLHAAWDCDDWGGNSVNCRLNAARLFKMVKPDESETPTDRENRLTLLVDILRRARQFDEALVVCDSALQLAETKIIVDILNFQKTLILNKDDGRYVVEQAVSEEKE